VNVCFATLLLLCLTSRYSLVAQTATRPLSVRDLDEVVSAVQEEFAALPGIAVSVINANGSTVRRTYGYRDVESKLAVTENTQFSIASLTKAYVAAAIRLAAEARELDINAPLPTIVPELALKPPLNPDHLSLRDLLTHRSGIQHDAVSFRTSMTGDATNTDVLQLLANSSVAIPRSFNYSNIGYVLAAIAVERRTGKTWNALVQEKVLTPAGLTQTTTGPPEGPDVAQRYVGAGRNTFVRLPARTRRASHAAGGMSSNLVELTHWMRLNIDSGRLNGRQVIPASVIAELHSVQIGLTSTFGGFRRVGYGLGWYVVDSDGERMIQCFGSNAGARVHLSFIPRLRVGVVVITNEGREGVYLPDVIAHGLYDRLLGRKDRSARQEKRFEEQRAWFARVKAAKAGVSADYQRRIPIQASAAVARFTGVYDDPEYGTIRIEESEGGLRAVMGDLSSFLRQKDAVTFTADFTPGGLPDPQELKFRRGDRNTSNGFDVQFGRRPSYFVRRPE
jgi:CubicO group peptidase (beta-lactamase class C family)